jgi:hypothetical protein
MRGGARGAVGRVAYVLLGAQSSQTGRGANVRARAAPPLLVGQAPAGGTRTAYVAPASATCRVATVSLACRSRL